MNSIFLFFFDGIYYLLSFQTCNKKEIDKFEDPDNWSNMGF